MSEVKGHSRLTPSGKLVKVEPHTRKGSKTPSGAVVNQPVLTGNPVTPNESEKIHDSSPFPANPDISLSLSRGASKRPESIGMLPNSSSWTITVNHNGESFSSPFFTGPGIDKDSVTTLDAFHSLANDALTGEMYPTAEDMAEEMGFDTDVLNDYLQYKNSRLAPDEFLSREEEAEAEKIIKTYNACVRIKEAFASMGIEPWEIVEEFEDMGF